MKKKAPPIKVGDYEVHVLGAPRVLRHDFYHGVMRLSWPRTITSLVATYLAANAVFAAAYLSSDGVANARGTFADAFFFSVQTMGTIGYGAMYPVSRTANTLVVIESVFSLLFTALVTGLVFAKFSRPSARLLFTHEATIGVMNGAPTFAFRMSNERGNRILEAQIRVVLTRTEITAEGKTFYRMLDLPLVRERAPSLSRSWMVLHVIDEKSPLFGETAATLAAKDAEILVSVVGTDDIWMQSVHASHLYDHSKIRWSARHVDILSENERGLILDLTKFHDTEPIELT